MEPGGPASVRKCHDRANRLCGPEKRAPFQHYHAATKPIECERNHYSEPVPECRFAELARPAEVHPIERSFDLQRAASRFAAAFGKWASSATQLHVVQVLERHAGILRP